MAKTIGLRFSKTKFSTFADRPFLISWRYIGTERSGCVDNAIMYYNMSIIQYNMSIIDAGRRNSQLD